MEKIKLNEEKGKYFIKEGLLFIGYPEDLTIKAYVLDSEIPYFEVYYESIQNGEKRRMIKPLTRKNVIELMKFSLQMNGYDNPFIDIKVRDEKIVYNISASIVTYGNSNYKKKR